VELSGLSFQDNIMVRQYDAQEMCNEQLKKLGTLIFDARTDATSFKSLWEQGWRTIFSKSEKYIGRCWHDSKRIELSLIHLNTRSEADLRDTILHEVGHALVGHSHGHNEVWKSKCIEIGLSDPKPCGAYINLDNGRAIQPSETKPKRQFHRVNKLCPTCSKQAEEQSSIIMSGVRWTKLKCGHLVKAESIKSSGFDLDNYVTESGKRPYPYQIEGIRFLETSGGRALIADEPGLGKTLQALLFCFAHKEVTTPVLWVCKTTLKLQALKEALEWCGFGFMGQIIENPRSRILPGIKLYIISMDLLRNMSSEKLDSIGYKTVVADEIQHFKNPDSTRTAELRKLVSKAEYFIPLSGTPWKNRGSEYFPVLNMLDPVRFPSYENFKNRWVETYLDSRTGKIKQGGIRNIPIFREYTKDLVIRRMRDVVLPDLPKIRREIRYVDMEALHAKAYDQAEERVAHIIKAAMIDGEDPKNIAAQIMVLKHITGIAKTPIAIEDALEWLENSPDEAEKLTIFHHHIDVGDMLQNGDVAKTFEGLDKLIKERGYKTTLRLFGGRGPEERNRVIEKFKNDPQCRILIASTLASGEGLNIQFCQNAMMLERQWNPANEEQAELRFSRPLTHQDYPTYLQDFLFNEDKNPKKVSIRVPYLIADQTVDSMLTEIVERKRTFFRKSMNVGEENIKWEENDIIRELSEMIIKKRFGRK